MRRGNTYTKYQQVYQKRQTEQQLIAAGKEIARKDTQLSAASDAVQAEMRKRILAESRFKNEGGAVVVMAHRDGHQHGDQWIASIVFRPRELALQLRNYRESEVCNMHHIARDVCRKAENELAKLLTEIFTGR